MRGSRARIVLAGLLAAACAWPASAQLAPGVSGFSDAPTTADETEYWLMMGEMGACLASRKADQARDFIASPIDSEQETKAFEVLFHARLNPCLGNFIRAGMVRAHVRGLVAEGLFERLDRPGGELTFAAEAPETIANMHDFARCYVIAHPAKAEELLRSTRVSTKGELAFIRTMSADFAPCLPQETTVNLRPTHVRFAIAEALYRLATGAPAPTIASSK